MRIRRTCLYEAKSEQMEWFRHSSKGLRRSLGAGIATFSETKTDAQCCLGSGICAALLAGRSWAIRFHTGMARSSPRKEGHGQMNNRLLTFGLPGGCFFVTETGRSMLCHKPEKRVASSIFLHNSQFRTGTSFRLFEQA